MLNLRRRSLMDTRKQAENRTLTELDNNLTGSDSALTGSDGVSTDRVSQHMSSRIVKIGNKAIGGGLPILIQSMTNTTTADVTGTVNQIHRLEEAGCEIVRCTVPDMESAAALKDIKRQIHIPLVADIHFDWHLAVAAIEAGADKIRINPGNIGSAEGVRNIVKAAKDARIPIRVGVNSGSLSGEILRQFGGPTAEALAYSAEQQLRAIEDCGYDNLVVSVKSTDVNTCVRAHEILAASCRYPIHVGITEAGTAGAGSIRSAVGLGIILHEGIGDTVRVSLTTDPVREVWAARIILQCLGLRKEGIQVISCPTCGRTKIDLETLATAVEELASHYPYNIKIAVMGCAVNGPGEAREADLGIAGGDGEGLIFRHGEIVRKVPESELLSSLKEELDKYSSGC